MAVSKGVEDLGVREKEDVAALRRLLRLLVSAGRAEAQAIWLLRRLDEEQCATLWVVVVDKRVPEELDLRELLFCLASELGLLFLHDPEQ
eukprot:739545-Alexandrium_andersonii.AAC.1